LRRPHLVSFAGQARQAFDAVIAVVACWSALEAEGPDQALRVSVAMRRLRAEIRGRLS
jgi:hypothetical protein